MTTYIELVCSICLINIDNTSKNIIKTECNHVFHSNCFLQNVAFNGFGCPNCRNVLANKPDSGIDNQEEEEEEQYILNGSRWLFMRAEGGEIDKLLSYAPNTTEGQGPPPSGEPILP